MGPITLVNRMIEKFSFIDKVSPNSFNLSLSYKRWYYDKLSSYKMDN